VHTYPKSYLIDFTDKVRVRLAKSASSSPRTPFDAQPGNESLSPLPPHPALPFWTTNRFFGTTPKPYLVECKAKF
jgi:hypothetical protein